MATQVQFRGGTTAQNNAFTGASKELTVDTDKDVVVVHDGATAGGHPLMAEDGSNSALALGTAGTPALKFIDTNTGIYSPGADQFAISTGGSERARIDSDGRLLVGTSTTRGDNSTVQIVNNSANALEIFRNQSSLFGPGLILNKSRGSTASPAVVLDGDDVGTIVFRGYSGAASSYLGAARIEGQIDGTPDSGGGTTDMPGRLVFSTTAAGASSPTEQLRITSDRYIRLASGTGGIQFNGDTAAANALDDYEEGTFTPTINGKATGGTGTYSAQIGRYVKIGKQVTVWIKLTWSAHTGTGDAIILGLPFTSQAIIGGQHPFAATVGYEGNYDVAANTVLSAYVEPNQTRISLAQTGVGTQSGASNAALDTAAGLTISATYETA